MWSHRSPPSALSVRCRGMQTPFSWSERTCRPALGVGVTSIGCSRQHRWHDRLVLLPAIRLAERVRLTAGRRRRWALHDHPECRDVHDSAALHSEHCRPPHEVPGRGRSRRGARLHAGHRRCGDRAPPAGAPRACRAWLDAVRVRHPTALRLRPPITHDRGQRARVRVRNRRPESHGSPGRTLGPDGRRHRRHRHRRGHPTGPHPHCRPVVRRDPRIRWGTARGALDRRSR